jgi:acyl carrier protein
LTRAIAGGGDVMSVQEIASLIDIDGLSDLIRNSSEADLSGVELHTGTDFFNDLQFNSIAFLSLALQLSSAFNLDLSKDYIRYFEVKTMGDLVNFLENKVKE